MKKLIVLASLLALAACNKPPASTGIADGQAQRLKVDAATKAYGDCIDAGARSVDVGNDAAGSIGDRVVAACKEDRNKLIADVASFHQIGHPKDPVATSRAVAEASVATLEDDLRQKTVVTIVSRQTAATAGTAKAK